MQSSLKFGTSGLRGLANELNGPPAYAYARAFVDLAVERGYVKEQGPVFVGRDLRSSSPDIAGLCLAAIEDAGLKAIDCGELPTPALSCHAIANSAPSIMVTGSHIPDDRNGLKFYRPDGEIDKSDEVEICRLHRERHIGHERRRSVVRAMDGSALGSYRNRYLDFMPAKPLAGLGVGVYKH